MPADSVVHIVRKDDYTQQQLVELDPSLLPPLAPSSVRMRTRLVGLTANNTSYAKSGTLLHWWDTFPVPSTAPAPFNQVEEYGIVPAWGYATVLESKVGGLEEGDLIWGFWPLSTLPVDLQLDKAAAPGHFIETSPHRKAVMPLYQRYIRMEHGSALLKSDLESLSWDALLAPLWGSAFVLNHFAYAWKEDQAISPSGPAIAWTASDADLTDAVVVILAASGKTALSMAQQFKKSRPAGSGPKAIVGVTSQPRISFVESTGFFNGVIAYEDLNNVESLDVITKHGARKIVVCDVGGRDNAAESLYETLKDVSLNITTIAVATEAKQYTSEELSAYRATFQRIGKVQMNASAIREAAIQKLGEAECFGTQNAAWQDFKSQGALPGVKITVGDGMSINEGVAQGWEKICRGGQQADQGLVFII